jgi:thymidylate synthase ThyX
MPARKIYLLSPKELSPETIAVAFAKTSRSPESFREIAAGLTDESSAQFNEKWVVGYGHASVAEHAVLHIALENISRLAVECLESNRLASYTEKSTRYQKWDAENFYTPQELTDRHFLEEYQGTCRTLFKTYLESIAPLKKVIESRVPRKEKETEEAFDRRIRSGYIDSCRFLLPAASLANLGMTINARSLEHAICKMLSHSLMEVQIIGEEVKKVAQEEVPTLVKYAVGSEYMQKTPEGWEIQPDSSGLNAENGDWCRLVNFDPEGELKILAAVLYRNMGMGYTSCLEMIKNSPPARKKDLADELVESLGVHDRPVRELEHTSYTFDLILDQGAFAEFKRHRMMTQTPQRLTTGLGYVTPRLMIDAEFEKQYQSAMELADKTYKTLVDKFPQVASYIVPNGYNRRVLFTMNLREAFAFCRLRSARNAHFSIRRVANRIAEEIRNVHPLLTQGLVNEGETWQQIEREHFS